MLHIMEMLGALMSMTAYSAAAVYALYTDVHRDMCPFYVAIAFAAVLHFGVAVIQWFKRKQDQLSDHK